jgi:hypothetical protein
MRALPVAERTAPAALALGPALLARAETERVIHAAASLVAGPAVVIGASQRAGRVVDLDACAAAGATVLRRATSGTAAYIGQQGVVWSIALPHVAAIVPDATPRTLLNRNVRPLLDALGAHYFGREWISVRRRPAALLGFEATPSGAVLIEALAGLDAPVALPHALAAEEERALDRWLGKSPAALGELGARSGRDLAEAVIEAIAKRAQVAIEPAAPIDASPAAPVTDARDPVPPGFAIGPLVRVPIGWIDTAFDRATGRAWLGGDVLAPAHALEAIAARPDGAAALGAIAIEGAKIEDLAAAARA